MYKLLTFDSFGEMCGQSELLELKWDANILSHKTSFHGDMEEWPGN